MTKLFTSYVDLKKEAMKDLEAGPEYDVQMTGTWARAIKSQLEDMDCTQAANMRLLGYKEGTPVYRTRAAVTNGVRKKLKELMMDFQGLRQGMMMEYKEAVGRQYFTVTGEYPDEEEHGRGKVLETAVEIQDRHNAAKEIEKSLLELHQVFLDMAIMVKAQGEQMDDIEHRVMNVAQYVKDGTKNLKTAKDYQRNSRKRMCGSDTSADTNS
ncbi:Syntaxin-related protein KNOLLE [Vitis vinifera]|uniref:Syntaxin-related protein KNOLLE n=1 Tax=Vitis vinifera TaxID=29760 RepID=A0A438CEW6_VITVI|nr:Syntaxin-related protein KNOLLE [Vitis vinifera]